MNIINWCNNNQGFIEVILSILTLSVSICAIIISLITAKLPFKRKLDISCGTSFGIGDDFEGIYVTATNVGNRVVHICMIGFYCRKNIYFNKNTISESTILLKPGEFTSQYIDKNDYKIFLKNNTNAKIYAFVKDESGKKYKKYLCKVKKLN